MKKYLVYFKNNWQNVILAPVLMCVDAICSVLQPFFIAEIIDKGIATGDTGYIIKMGLYIVALAIGTFLGGFGCMYFSAKASYGFGANLREALMKKVQEFSFANINKFTTASLITRITNDVEVLVQLVQMCLRMLIRAPFLFIGGVFMAISLNKQMSLIILALIPFLGLLIFFAIKKAFPLFSIVQKKIDRVNSIIRENLIGARVVKAFVREEYEKERFGIANTELKDTAVRSFNIMILLSPGITLIMSVGIAAVIWIGSKFAIQGVIEVGQISSYISYMIMTLSSLIMIIVMLMNLSRAKASSERIFEVLNEEVDIQDSKVENVEKEHKIITGKVEYNIESFEFTDSEGTPILENIKFTVNPGERVAIIGSTGTGKSTLVNLMPRFYDVTKGYVKIDDVDVREYKLEDLRQGIGMVLQENRLFSGTIRENLLWGNENATEEDIIKACSTARIWDYIKSKKDGLESRVEQRGTNYSGGQKQRLCIARALIKKPKILILDDSVSALDAKTERELTDALRKEFAKTTTFTITQRISSCLLADKILVIDDGTIVGVGTHNELLESCEVYKEIYDSQGMGGDIDG